MDYREVNAAMRNWYDNKRQSLEFLGKSIIKNERNPLGDVRGFRLLSKAMVYSSSLRTELLHACSPDVTINSSKGVQV